MNRSTPILLVLLAVPLAVPLATAFNPPTADYFSARLEGEGGTYVEGFLAVQSGTKSIQWDPSAASEDPWGPTSDAAQSAQNTVAEYGNTYVDRSAQPIRVDEFVSAPLRETLHLNASRYVQFDVAIAGRRGDYSDPCHFLDPLLYVELYADGQLIAGTTFDQYLEWYYVNPNSDPYRPADPPGFGYCYFRLALETDTLSTGTVLKLRVLVMRQDSDVRWGLAGDHRSILRLPVFTADEWIFRDPAFKATLVRDEGKENDSDGNLMGLVAGAVGLLTLPHVRRRHLAPLLLAAMLLAAGCMGGGGPSGAASPSAGTVSYSIQDRNGTAADTTGAIIGRIHDDLHIPVAGAHVSLLGTGNFTTSDARGGFALKRLVPGEYRIRFDHDQLRSLEQTVMVAAGANTVLDVTMVPIHSKESGRRPHNHDYWGDDLAKTVFEGPLGTTCPGAAQNQCEPEWKFRIRADKVGQATTILPGTSKVVVTATWGADLGYERLGLSVHPNNPDQWDWEGNRSLFYPRESGKPFQIATSWEMSDSGHDVVSGWTFEFYVAPHDGETTLQYEQDYGLAYARISAPTIQVKIEIHKGSIPLEPGHPDHWKGSNVRKVLEGYGYDGYSYSLIPPGAPSHQPYYLYYNGQDVVPPETTWIQVNLTLGRDPATAWVPTVYYRDGTHPWRDSWEFTGDPIKHGFTKLSGPVGKQGRTFLFRFEVKPGQADGVYATSSNWQFAFGASDDAAQWTDSATGAVNGYISLMPRAFAHRDPFPA